MNTTAAATQAGVTIPTVRTWCRVGAVAAVKQAGRWVIDAASLAARIAIGQLKKGKRTVTTRTYTTPSGETIAVTIKTSTRRGQTITRVRGIAALFADELDAFADEGDRGYAVDSLRGSIAFWEVPDETLPAGHFVTGMNAYSDHGRIRASTAGCRQIPLTAVLDRAAQLRDELGLA